MKKQIIERLTRYVKIDTQSNPDSKTTPSTNKQWDLLNLLEEELQSLGLKTDMDEHGYLLHSKAILIIMYLLSVF